MDHSAVQSFTALVGSSNWTGRIRDISGRIDATRAGKLTASRFAVERAVEKARRGLPLSPPETALVEIATRIPHLHQSLTPVGKVRLDDTLAASLSGDATMLPLLHLLNTAQLQRKRGFDVSFTGFEEGAPFDLSISREGEAAEIACDTISAEDGHCVHRGAWTALADRIDPDLQTWLAAHPGRYLLKMTLPNGLSEADNLPALHARINAMLIAARRSDYDEAAVLRLDPLLLAGAKAAETKLRPSLIMTKLRSEFGPEAHFAITEAGQSLFVIAARGGSENQVATALRRRLAAIAPARLTGDKPGILAMFVEDTDQREWKTLREHLLLESEARQFLTFPEARPVIAVTCVSRYELMKAGAPEGDLRFRNPMHPAAKSLALAPAVISTN